MTIQLDHTIVPICVERRDVQHSLSRRRERVRVRVVEH